MLRYKKWHFLIDLVGIIGLMALFAYWRWGHAIGEKDPELINIWANLSTELVGAWAAARVIEYAIRKNDENSRVRIRTARNLRFYFNLLTRCIEYSYRPEVEQLGREVQWSRSFFGQNRSNFSDDEISDIERCFDALDGLGEVCRSLFSAKVNENADYEQIRSEAWELLRQYEDMAIRAEINIFEETPEVPI